MSESAKASTDSDVEERVLEREDLIERSGQGDAGALGELFEHATGAQVKSVKVTIPRSVAPPNGG